MKLLHRVFYGGSHRAILLSCLVMALLLTLLYQQFMRGTAHGIPLETNLLRLLPATESNPVAEQAVDHLARALGDRVLFLVGLEQRAQAVQAAKNFGNDLQQSRAFKNVRVEIPALNLDQIRAPFLSARFNLLSSADRADLARDPVGALQQRLQQRLSGMLTGGVGLPLVQDPFDYLGRFLAELPWQDSTLSQQNSVLLVEQGKQTWVLVLAELNGSAFTESVQDQVIANIAQAEKNLHMHHAQAQLLRTGGVFYAQAARVSAQRDVELIGTISTVGILLLLWVAFRSPVPLLLIVVSVVVGLSAALLVTVQWFGSLHLLTLVFGASLIGEAVDYAIQVCSVHAGTQTDSTNGAIAGGSIQRNLAPLWPSLMIALATSVLGYVVLFFTPFPALNQIALFASSGLLAAFLVVRCGLPLGLSYVTPGRAQPVIDRCQHGLQQLQQHLQPRHIGIVCAVIVLLAVPGWWLSHVDDDIRLLTTRPPVLVEQEQHLRRLIEKEQDAEGGARFFLVEGDSEQQVLQREEQLRAVLEPLQENHQIGSLQALSAFIPSQQRQQENRTLLQQAGLGDPAKLAFLLDQTGFDRKVASQLVAAFQHSENAKMPTVAQWLASPIATPYRHLWLGQTAQGYASIVIPKEIRRVERLRELVLPQGVHWVDKAANVSQLFAFYRHAGVLGLGLMLLVLFGVLAGRYGWSGSACVLLPTGMALISAPAVLGYLHLPLTLFSILALFLVLGVGVNYAIFLLDGARLARQQPPSLSPHRSQQSGHGAYGGGNLLGVLLSSLTTLLSFGLLGFSSMPVLRQFGVVLAVGIALAVLLAPIVLVWERRRGVA